MKKYFIAFIALAACLTACKKEENVNYDSAAVVGKWKLMTLDGQQVLTDDRIVYTFANNGTGSQTLSEDLTGIGEQAWYVQQKLKYTLQGNALHTQWTNSAVVLEWLASIQSLNETTMVTEPSRVLLNTTPFEDIAEATWQRVATDYSNDIIGLWEGTDCSGITYGDWHHRWLYTPGGQYYYFSQDTLPDGTWNGKWVISENALNEYDVDGDYLACRWKEKIDAKEDREFWDIAIQNNNMHWDALRKDERGRFEATFDMYRVSPTEEEARQKLPGKWIAIMENGEPILTNHKSVHTFDNEGNVYYTIADNSQATSEWHNRLALRYSLMGGYLVESGKDNNGQIIQWRSALADKGANSITTYSFVGNRPAKEGFPYCEITFQKVMEDYSQDIIGMWEGIAGGGDYGDYNHRWEYMADGTYNYWNPTPDGGWEKAASNDGRYMVDGTWMASRWTDSEDKTKMDYEWWDVTISATKDTMSWSGLRENGITTWFKMVRVK